MRADFDPLVEVFFRLDALADIPDDAQKAPVVLIIECRPTPLSIKYAAIPSYVHDT